MSHSKAGRVAPVRHIKKAKKKDPNSRGRKIGRNKSWCSAYRAGCRQLINKKRKLRRHIRRYPADLNAQKALDRLR